MIADWSDAYRNSRYIAGGDAYPAYWAAAAAEFRGRSKSRLDLRYGPGPRHLLDLFLPEARPKGLAVFVHGGYWMDFDKSSWSHLAQGAVARGWAVAVPSYTLAPAARIAQITAEIGQAIAHAASLIDGPIRLAGHSAGGHLVSRMLCADAPLPPQVRSRLAHVLSISGVHDLRPLLLTDLNRTLRIDEAEAAGESPALLRPVAGAPITCWVGSEERPEFLRQNDLLANIWTGLGAETTAHHAPGLHHFNVIDGLQTHASPITSAFAGP